MSLRDDAAHPVDAVHHDGRTGGTPLHLAAAAGAVPGLSAEGFRRLAAQLWVSLFVADLAGTIVYVNDAAARLLGRSREELLGLTIVATFHHAALGLQVVVEDYVHREGVKLALLILLRAACWGLAAAALVALLFIAFRG